jgi:phenylpropionate dioxygenase-like ring-hydroxylating dioxygenase large terminal subunit
MTLAKRISKKSLDGKSTRRRRDIGRGGEAARRILASVKRDLEKGLIPARVFGDRGLYGLELRRIFARSWLFIGHESELPNRGDFAVRYMGEDPFIFVRDADGVIRVLFNACRHRGTQLCRAEKGNAAQFTCPYHGWTYRNDGRLTGVPAKHLGYRKLDLSQWGLFSAAQVASYGGLVFATLDPEAVPLADYLGKYRWYLDIQLKLTPGGMEVLGEPHRWLVDANWKQGAENFCGDSSHTQMTHRSTINVGLIGASAAGAPGAAYGLQVNECDGHAISIRQQSRGQSVFWEYPEEVTRLFSAERLHEAQFDLARRAMAHVGTVFPNFSFLHVGLTDSLDRPPGAYLSIRVWQPRGPGKTEIWNWILAPKEASPEYKRRAYRLGMSSFSPSGSFEQDDVAIWPGIARTAASVFAETHDMKFNYQMGLGENFDVAPLADWPGPGVAIPSNAGEGGLRGFHWTWYRQMTAGGR